MSILGLGVDVVHVPRITALLKRRSPQKLAARILSQAEFEKWHALPKHDDAKAERFLAVRWAVKEAAYKALYPHVRLTWKDLTYNSLLGSTKPSLRVSEHLRHAGALHVSVSHDGEYVFATVIAEQPSNA